MIPEVRACPTPAPHHPALPHQPDITRERRGPGFWARAAPSFRSSSSSSPTPPPTSRTLAPSMPTACRNWTIFRAVWRSEEHTSELQSPDHLVCRLLLEKKKE